MITFHITTAQLNEAKRICASDRILAVKYVRNETGARLREAKILVIDDDFDTSKEYEGWRWEVTDLNPLEGKLNPFQNEDVMKWIEEIVTEKVRGFMGCGEADGDCSKCVFGRGKEENGVENCHVISVRDYAKSRPHNTVDKEELKEWMNNFILLMLNK